MEQRAFYRLALLVIPVILFLGAVGPEQLVAAEDGAASEQGASDRAKVIIWFHDPNTPHRAIKVMDSLKAMGVDGMVMWLTPDRSPGANAGLRLSWQAEVYKPEDFAEGLKKLKVLRQNFDEIFLLMAVIPGVNWFDEQGWQGVLGNTRLAAQIVKDYKLSGILLDVEQYRPKKIFSWPVQRKMPHGDKSFEEYQQRVREGGRQFVRTFNEVCPNSKVMLTFGTYFAKLPLKDASYGLLPAFIDGLVEGADSGTRIVDIFEPSYGYKEEPAFRDSIRFRREIVPKMSAVPDKFRKKISLGFGLWVDLSAWRFPEHFSFTDFSDNFFTPLELARAIHFAAKYADKDAYVWLYCQLVTPPAFPDAYVKAFRTGIMSKDVPGLPGRVHAYPKHGRKLKYDESQVFGDLLESHEELVALANEWKFRTDPTELGIKENWFGMEYDDQHWRSLGVDNFWEEQGIYYDGYAWYRTWVEVPASGKGKEAVLVFGAVDESAWVYVNGKLAGAHDIREEGWDKRFSIEIKEQLVPGQRNLIAVRVLDRSYSGGIWRSVKLLTPRTKDKPGL